MPQKQEDILTKYRVSKIPPIDLKSFELPKKCFQIFKQSLFEMITENADEYSIVRGYRSQIDLAHILGPHLFDQKIRLRWVSP